MVFHLQSQFASWRHHQSEKSTLLPRRVFCWFLWFSCFWLQVWFLLWTFSWFTLLCSVLLLWSQNVLKNWDAKSQRLTWTLKCEHPQCRNLAILIVILISKIWIYVYGFTALHSTPAGMPWEKQQLTFQTLALHLSECRQRLWRSKRQQLILLWHT